METCWCCKGKDALNSVRRWVKLKQVEELMRSSETGTWLPGDGFPGGGRPRTVQEMQTRT